MPSQRHGPDEVQVNRWLKPDHPAYALFKAVKEEKLRGGISLLFDVIVSIALKTFSEDELLEMMKSSLFRKLLPLLGSVKEDESEDDES